MLTAGNVDDRKPVKHLCEDVEGLLFGDKGYISTKLFKELYEYGLKLITKIRSNMKNILTSLFEKFLLKKRGVVECAIQFLKESCQIEHTRHRSSANFIVNLMSGLVAYCIFAPKASMGLRNNEKQLLLKEITLAA